MRSRLARCTSISVLLLALFAVGAVVVAAATAATKNAQSASDISQPAFAQPDGGSSVAEGNSFGGVETTLLNADGTVYATRDSDGVGRVITTTYYSSNGNTETVAYAYDDSTFATRRLAGVLRGRAASRTQTTRCGNDVENTGPYAWSNVEHWSLNVGSEPTYLDPAKTLSSLRSAHAEWANMVSWCNYGDYSNFASSYDGSTTRRAGQVDGVSVVDFGAGSCPAGATAWSTRWSSFGVINESDTRICTSAPHLFTNGLQVGRFDIWSVMAHQQGLAMGFGSVSDATNVMYYRDPSDDTSKQELGKGDANEDSYLYHRY